MAPAAARCKLAAKMQRRQVFGSGELRAQLCIAMPQRIHAWLNRVSSAQAATAAA
jgi:hypothetical protein